MSGNQNFFLSPQAAAIYKHELLKRYIPAFVGKVGSTAQGKRVMVYDAYSGPGRYQDQAPGSPEILVDTAVAMAKLRSIFTIFSDQDAQYCKQVEAMVLSKGVDPSTFEVRPGSVDKHIDAVVASAGDAPLFIFLDPYGFSLPLEHLVDVLSRRDNPNYYSLLLQPKTEVLINFSFEAVRRCAGALTSAKDYPSRQGTIDSLSRFLGGDWWQDMVRSGDPEWIQSALQRYAEEVGKRARFGFITASVADSLTAEPVYELILFTRHEDGLWKMMDAMSHARTRWRDLLAESAQSTRDGQGEIRGLDWDDNEEAWVEEIAANVNGILAKEPGFVIGKRLGEVLGRTLGLARETHIRRALVLLHSQGRIAEVPTGSKQKSYITRK